MKEGTGRFLVFTLRGTRYALDLQDVAEVVEPPPTFPIPRSPDHFIGVMNFHGNLVSILDLAHFYYQGNFTPDGKVLVLDRRLASLALWVDGVAAIVAAKTIQRNSAPDDDMTAGWILTGTEEIGLLSLDILLQRLEATIND
jgi:purine-binding chemotaxis protein CheW